MDPNYNEAFHNVVNPQERNGGPVHQNYNPMYGDRDCTSEESSDDCWSDRRILGRQIIKLTTFGKHKASVISCALHPNHKWAVTTCQNYNVYVWSIVNGEVLFRKKHNQCKGKAEVYFSDDGDYLAMGNHTGKLCVYQIQETVEEGEDGALFQNVLKRSMNGISWMCWYSGVNRLIVANGDGDIYIFSIPTGICIILSSPGDLCYCGKVTNDNEKLYTAYEDNSLRLWDLNSYTVIMQVNSTDSMAHTDIINAVTCDAELFVSGSLESSLLFCDIDGPIARLDADASVICLSISPAKHWKLIACATFSGAVTIWISFGSHIYRQGLYKFDDGITDMKWISNYKVVLTTVGGDICSIDSVIWMPKLEIYAHMRFISQMDYDLNTRTILTVSNDKTATIWRYLPTNN